MDVIEDGKTQCVHCGTYFEVNLIEAHKQQCPEKKKAAALQKIADNSKYWEDIGFLADISEALRGIAMTFSDDEKRKQFPW